MHATVIARGLEPTLGILHPPSADRPSLALDLIEPLRHAIIDRLVLRAANLRELQKSDFEELPVHDSSLSEKPNDNQYPSNKSEVSGSYSTRDTGVAASEQISTNGVQATIPPTFCRFTDDGRRKFLRLYHETMEGTLHTTDGSSTPVRALISRAVEAYERALQSNADDPTPAEATATEMEVV
jgi:CRISPR/Cas system-associated endonuclease Cas1